MLEPFRNGSHKSGPVSSLTQAGMAATSFHGEEHSREDGCRGFWPGQTPSWHCSGLCSAAAAKLVGVVLHSEVAAPKAPGQACDGQDLNHRQDLRSDDRSDDLNHRQDLRTTSQRTAGGERYSTRTKDACRDPPTSDRAGSGGRTRGSDMSSVGCRKPILALHRSARLILTFPTGVAKQICRL